MKKNILNNLLLGIGIFSLIIFVIPNNKVSAENGYDDNRNNYNLREREDDSSRRDDDGPLHDINDDRGGLRQRLLGDDSNRSRISDDSETREGLYRKIHEFAKHRYETMTERLTKLQTRVQTRIDKVKLEGKDTTLAQNALTISIAKSTEAKGFIASAKALIDANVNTVPIDQTVKDQIKDYFKKAKDSFKASHEALKDSVRQLKILSGGSASPSSNDNSNN